MVFWSRHLSNRTSRVDNGRNTRIGTQYHSTTMFNGSNLCHLIQFSAAEEPPNHALFAAEQKLSTILDVLGVLTGICLLNKCLTQKERCWHARVCHHHRTCSLHERVFPWQFHEYAAKRNVFSKRHQLLFVVARR